MHRILRRPLLLLLLLSPCLASAHDANEVRVGGGGAAIMGLFAPVSETFQNETGIRLFLNISNPVKGLIELDKGQIDIATGAISLKEMIDGAAQKGVRINPANLHEMVIGSNQTTFIVNKSNPITKLNKQQLKEIFSGKANNWKAFGGQDEEIVVVWGENTPGQNALVSKGILEGQPVVAKRLVTSTYTDIRKAVMETPGAIGFVPETLLSSQIKPVESPKVETLVIAVTKGKLAPQDKKLLDFVKEIGALL